MLRIPDARKWSLIVVNSSSGKDSQTALRQVVLAADRQGFPRDRIVVSHQILDKVEWEGTEELARLQAEHYNLRFMTSRYRNRDGLNPDLLDYVRRRGKWPDNQNRFCTSEFKRAPGNRILTKLRRERPGHILQVFGFRAEESPARRKRPSLQLNKRPSTKQWEVWDWLPIQDWTLAQVWADIRESGVPYHPAYDLGMPRLSCTFCVFAPRAALLRAGKANRALLDEYCEVEEQIGHDFQHNKPIRAIRDALDAGEEPGECSGAWNM